ncbi:hypothetical protein AYO27_24435 [Rhizobium sp. GHKF11]|nr:hypothetical protein AYO27_24435 [Rhizobium sp. GHKF11]
MSDKESVRIAVEEYIKEDLIKGGFLSQAYKYDENDIPAAYLFDSKPSDFLKCIYRILLHRSCCGSELEHYKGLLTDGILRTDIMRGILQSEEFKQNQKQPSRHIELLIAEEEFRQKTRQTGVGSLLRGLLGFKSLPRGLAINTDPSATDANGSIIQSGARERRRGDDNKEDGREHLKSVLRKKPYRREDINLLKQDIMTELDRRHRGPSDVVRKQLEAYIPHLVLDVGNGKVLDIGCGRGTFLEILRDNGVEGVGLEINEEQRNECVSKGLVVHLEDAFVFLKNCDENSFATITLFHVIEHLEFEDLILLLNEIYRVLAFGGTLLMETPNSENLFVSTFFFNVDPTHVKPITYQYISTVLEVIGYRCERLPASGYINEDGGEPTQNIHLNHLLFVAANLLVKATKGEVG